MLRLWPERHTLFLMPEGGWMASGKVSRTASPGAGTPVQQVQDMAQQLLSPLSGMRSLVQTLDVVLSDDICRLSVLPWQPRLRGADERRRYAEACMESEGIGGDQWVVQGGYRSFGAPGLAVAVRRDLLSCLIELAATRALRLRSVLPLGAVAYWRHRPIRRHGEVLILDQGRLITAMAYVQGTLKNIDIQPAAGNRSLALTQLARRCQAGMSDVAQLIHWNGATSALDESILTAAWPGALIKNIARGSWQ